VFDPAGNDYPHTYGDMYGSLIDFSGISGVWVCYTCGEQGGPEWTVADTKAQAALHRQKVHTVRIKDKRVSTVTAEAKALSVAAQCQDCEAAAYKRELCQPCNRKRIIAWLRENGLAGPTETLTHYLKHADIEPATTGRWAGHVKGTPASTKPTESTSIND
jgi:hypothetical protein